MMKLQWLLTIVAAAGLLILSACGSGNSSASECDLCTLQEHYAALGTPGPVPDHCATGHGADGHRLECNACESKCAPNAASLRCGNATDSSVCVDGIY